MARKEKEDAIEETVAVSGVAKKDFVIHHNEVHIEIKKGEKLPDIPEMYKENLKTEGVI